MYLTVYQGCYVVPMYTGRGLQLVRVPFCVGAAAVLTPFGRDPATPSHP